MVPERPAGYDVDVDGPLLGGEDGVVQGRGGGKKVL